MGMFDDLNCKYPLPAEAKGITWFQTKDTPAQALDVYEITETGELWHQEYDFEDRSDPDAEGILRLAGMLTRVRKRWIRCDTFTGGITFYAFKDAENHDGWIEFTALFKCGQLLDLVLVENRDP